MKLGKLFTAFIAVMTISGMALARGPVKDHKSDDLAPIEKHFSPDKIKNLGLSDEQKDKLKQIRKSHKDDGQKLREEMKIARKAFKDSLRTNASREEVLKAYEAMSAKKSELGKARIEGLLSAREVLTAEQRAKLFGKEED